MMVNLCSMTVNYRSILTLEIIGFFTTVIYHVKLQKYFYNIGTRCRCYKHFPCVTRCHSKMGQCILKTFHRSVNAINNGRAYFARAVSYACKMFMKSTTGVHVTKTFQCSWTNWLECLLLAGLSSLA